MNCYRVTKYNPKFRSKDGVYQRHDWTSVSDVGKSFADGVLSVVDYLQVEDRYIAAIEKAAALTGSAEFAVEDFECTGEPEGLPPGIREDSFSMLADFASGATVPLLLTTACAFARLALREIVWGRLSSQSGLYVHFGYDFNMYIGDAGDRLKGYVVGDLFVEDFPSPYASATLHHDLSK